MAKWIIIYGVVAIVTGIVFLVKYLGWKNYSSQAECRISELQSAAEKNAGGNLFKKEIMYQCRYKTTVIGDFGTVESTLQKDFPTAAAGAAFVGQTIRGVSKADGRFLSDEQFNALGKSWFLMILSGVLCILFATVLMPLVFKMV